MSDFPHVPHKWGFGMAPPKQEHLDRYCSVVRVVRDLVNGSSYPSKDTGLQALAQTKGLFNRCLKQNQWDYFILWSRFGYPEPRALSSIVRDLENLFSAWSSGDTPSFETALASLRANQLVVYLGLFLGEIVEVQQPGVGFVYVLETRENRNLLKVGSTERTVEVRTKEINQATGVLIPFGARAAWRVTDSEDAEKNIVHVALRASRVRPDREFFQMDFFQARGLITEALWKARRLVRIAVRAA